MKVIDLLNKIANGEEVPKEIRLGDKIDIFYYQDYIKSYTTDDNESLMCDYLCNTDRLNDEVEIIEEDKNIDRIENNFYHKEQIDKNEILKNKINEIIDYLEENKND